MSFNETLVTRYRMHLETRQLAPGTINARLAALRRLAYEAAEGGLLSPELAADILRVKGAQKRGGWVVNWLTPEEAAVSGSRQEARPPNASAVAALLAILLGCELHRREVAELIFDHLQRREDHWAIVGLGWKGWPR